jgi:ATP-dependent RNA helicase DDX10/DBP4
MQSSVTNQKNLSKQFKPNKNKKQEKFKPTFKKKLPTWKQVEKESSELLPRYEQIDLSKIEKFSDFPLSSRTLMGLEKSGYMIPTDIQRESIGIALKGNDLLGAAKTGSGKTLAFIIPVQFASLDKKILIKE